MKLSRPFLASRAIRESPQLSDGFEYERRMFARLRARHSSRTILWPWIVELTRCFMGASHDPLSSPESSNNRTDIKSWTCRSRKSFLFSSKTKCLDLDKQRRKETDSRNYVQKYDKYDVRRERIKKKKRKKVSINDNERTN